MERYVSRWVLPSAVSMSPRSVLCRLHVFSLGSSMPVLCALVTAVAAGPSLAKPRAQLPRAVVSAPFVSRSFSEVSWCGQKETHVHHTRQAVGCG